MVAEASRIDLIVTDAAEADVAPYRERGIEIVFA